MSVTGFNRRRRELAKVGGQAEQSNKKRQEAKTESLESLKQKAKAKGIRGWHTMKEEKLINLLKEGD